DAARDRVAVPGRGGDAHARVRSRRDDRRGPDRVRDSGGDAGSRPRAGRVGRRGARGGGDHGHLVRPVPCCPRRATRSGRGPAIRIDAGATCHLASHVRFPATRLPGPNLALALPMIPALLALFAYAFVSNVALAVVPHEPVVIWYGARLGIWITAVVATAGTVAAAWVDHRLFVPLFQKLAARGRGAATGRLSRLFTRAPFAILALSGLTPLPFFP